MNWKEMKSGKSTIMILTDETGTTWNDLAAGISDCLIRVGTEFASRIKSGEWDRIICELWFDSGRLIFRPSKKGIPDSALPIVVQLVSSFLHTEFQKISTEVDNPGFGSDVLNLRHKVLQPIRRATDDEHTNYSLQALYKQQEFQLFLQFGSDLDTRQEFFIDWKKPRKKKEK